MVAVSWRRLPLNDRRLVPVSVSFSGGVTSRDKVLWSVGGGAGFRLCVSAMLPDGGAGIWPAHWMMPNDNSCDPDEGGTPGAVQWAGPATVHVSTREGVAP